MNTITEVMPNGTILEDAPMVPGDVKLALATPTKSEPKATSDSNLTPGQQAQIADETAAVYRLWTEDRDLRRDLSRHIGGELVQRLSTCFALVMGADGLKAAHKFAREFWAKALDYKAQSFETDVTEFTFKGHLESERIRANTGVKQRVNRYSMLARWGAAVFVEGGDNPERAHTAMVSVNGHAYDKPWDAMLAGETMEDTFAAWKKIIRPSVVRLEEYPSLIQQKRLYDDAAEFMTEKGSVVARVKVKVPGQADRWQPKRLAFAAAETPAAVVRGGLMALLQIAAVKGVLTDVDFSNKLTAYITGQSAPAPAGEIIDEDDD